MALIEIKGLYKSFGRSEILTDINLDIEEGKVLVLIGPTGSGKTTLLRLIDTLDQPTRGSILFHEEDICRLSSKAKLLVRRRMAMVFQKPVMFSRSVYENVAYGLKARGKRNSRDEVLHTLEEVGLKGYKSRSATTLSGGEMQRIALARAMVIKPEVLLLDEPTANLDPRSASTIDYLIEHLAQSGTTVIIASHNMAECRRLANMVVVLVKGRITRTGRPNDTQLDRESSVGFLDSIDPSDKV
ncbi:Trehalose/maltose import ATP-binding protein MalK [uncultured archaeon]|nr:Trehalose/maltose import ATP-binding protein MalK [uncultured archaeon]